MDVKRSRRNPERVMVKKHILLSTPMVIFRLRSLSLHMKIKRKIKIYMFREIYIPMHGEILLRQPPAEREGLHSMCKDPQKKGGNESPTGFLSLLVTVPCKVNPPQDAGCALPGTPN